MSEIQSHTTAHALYEGTFSVGLDKKFNRITRDDPPSKGALKISINPFLIISEERKYLFDVGIGDFGEDTSTDTIKSNLSDLGFSELDITDIFLSHLHIDHIGGLAGRASGYWELTFPEAKIWTSGKDWENVIGQEEYYDEEKTAFAHFINAKADLQLMGKKEQPYPEITTRTIGGHTEFSQVLQYNNGKQKYLMAGDVLATRGEVNRKFAAKYDYEPEKSIEVRRELTRLSYKEGYTIMGYHDSHYPLFRLTEHEERKGYTIKSITADAPS